MDWVDEAIESHAWKILAIRLPQVYRDQRQILLNIAGGGIYAGSGQLIDALRRRRGAGQCCDVLSYSRNINACMTPADPYLASPGLRLHKQLEFPVPNPEIAIAA
jgi:hypothetical protein